MTQEQTKTLYIVAILGLIVFLFGILWQMRIQDQATQLLADSSKQLQEVKDRLAKTHKPNSAHQAAVTANVQALRDDPSLSLTFQNYTKDPYLGGVRLINYYKDNYGVIYTVDPYNNNILEFIIPASSSYSLATSSVLSNSQLKKITENYLLNHIANFAELEKTLTYTTATKPGGDTVMFQWEYTAQNFHDGTHPKLQVVMSSRGDVVHFMNTHLLKD
ncbi:MAG: hypothetical protein WC794_06055 [Candidatus Doudnabacteria bacterium]|jgi:hypothetical protein